MEPKTRVCKYCSKRQKISDFEIANVIKGKKYRRWRCKTCYQECKNERRKRIRKWLNNLKTSLICKQCGENDFRVLDFHHDEDNKKDFNIGDAIRLGYSQKRILEEIKKCDILCCKCHRILHWEKQYGV